MPRSIFRLWIIPLSVLAILMLSVACGPLIDLGQSTTAGYDSIRLTVQADRSRGGVGEPVHIRFTATNTSNKVKIVDSKDTPVLDATVEDPGNHQILLSWADLHPDQVVHHLELQPNESRVLEMVWVPTEEQYKPSSQVFISGVLSINSQVEQSATVYYCYGGCGG